MKKKFIIILTLLPFIVSAQQSFEINGKVGNWGDPAKVYLAYKINEKLFLDSSIIREGSFHFKGNIPSVQVAALILDRTPVGYMNLTNQTADYGQFYLGNESFAVISNDSMKNIAIVGSRINDSVANAGVQVTLQLKYPPGSLAPEFAQPDSTGNLVKLSDFRGKVVLLDFWASWCVPCRQENPNLVKAYRKFKDRGFEIFSISADNNKTAWIGAIMQDNMQWKHASDLKASDNAAVKLYQVETIPQNFLIGRDGRIIAVNLIGENLSKKLEEVFANP